MIGRIGMIAVAIMILMEVSSYVKLREKTKRAQIQLGVMSVCGLLAIICFSLIGIE